MPAQQGLAHRVLDLATCDGGKAKSIVSVYGGGEAANLDYQAHVAFALQSEASTFFEFASIGSAITRQYYLFGISNYFLSHSESSMSQAPESTTFPVAADALVVSLYVPGVTFGTGPGKIAGINMTLPLLSKMLTGRISFWNDTDIQAINPVLGPYLSGPVCVVYVIIEDEAQRDMARVLNRVDPDFWPANPPERVVFDSVNQANVVQTAYRATISYSLELRGQLLGSRCIAISYLSAARAGGMGTAWFPPADDPSVFVEPSQANIQAVVDATAARRRQQYTSPIRRDYDNDLMFQPGGYPLVQYLHMTLRRRPLSSSTISEDMAAQTAAFAEFFVTSTQREVISRRAFYGALPQEDMLEGTLGLREIRSSDGSRFLAPSGACIDAAGGICSGNGRCIERECLCNDGYEGSTCETQTPADTELNVQGILLASVLTPGSLAGGFALLACCIVGVVACIVVLMFLIVLAVIVLIALVLALLIVGAAALAALPATGIMIKKRFAKAGGFIAIDYSELDLDRQIGVGAFGDVFHGYWKDNEVAVKVLRSEAMTSKAIASFKEEMAIMQSLRHPNLLIQIGASVQKPNLAIVMEFMGNGSVYDLIHDIDLELTLQLRLRMALNMAEGVAFLHSINTVHRDIKSLNMLVDKNWIVKVSDFGLSTVKKAAGEGNMEGSVLWMAPEVMLSNDYSFASDVYAVGMVLWELMALDEPFAGMPVPAVVHSVSRYGQRPEVSEDWLMEVTALIEDCWAQNPGARPTISVVRDRLKSIVGGDGSSAHGSDVLTSSMTSNQFQAVGLSLARLSSRTSSRTGSSGSASSSAKSPRQFGTTNVPIVTVNAPGAEDMMGNADAQMVGAAAEAYFTAVRRAIVSQQGFETRVAASAECPRAIELIEASPLAMIVVLPKVASAQAFSNQVRTELRKQDINPALVEAFMPAIGIDIGDVESRRIHPFSSKMESRGDAIANSVLLCFCANVGQTTVSGRYRDSSLGLGSSPSSFSIIGQAQLSEDEPEDVFALMDGLSTAASSGSLREPSASLEKSAVPQIAMAKLSVQEKMGNGDHGVTFHVELEDGTEAAFKKTGRPLRAKVQQVNFRSDIMRMKELAHPNIVSVVALTMNPTGIILQLEETDLGSELAEGKSFSFPRVLKIARGMFEGLKHLHSQVPPIVHGNLKPTNVLLSSTGEARLTRFPHVRRRRSDLHSHRGLPAVLDRCRSHDQRSAHCQVRHLLGRHHHQPNHHPFPRALPGYGPGRLCLLPHRRTSETSSTPRIYSELVR